MHPQQPQTHRAFESPDWDEQEHARPAASTRSNALAALIVAFLLLVGIVALVLLI